ncbi:hypothetical protein BH23BAC1_BH23BAC1_01010 [soil metagenome]
MKKNQFYFIILVFAFAACKVAEREKTETNPLFQVGDTPVSTDDFIYVYEKNNYNNKDLSNRDEIRDYLDLYINFKLKIKEAEDLGLNQSESFKAELEGYKKQLARPYLTESQVTDQLVQEAYERLQEEIKAAHILITVDPDADPADTLKAFQIISELREKAVKVDNFSELAYEYSQDPSAKTNYGDLGYFTALQMVYPFEDAAYETKVGKISLPVRTRFGYHIIKVKDRRPSRGKIKVAHIMIRATEGIPAEDSITARNKIYEIHNQLKSGSNWQELAQQFSEDINTRAQGGSLPWFGTGNMIPEFEEAAYALEEESDFSEPVKTVYGWHIIKFEEKKGLESFEELSSSLKAKVAKDSRSELNRAALLKRLKEENNFKEFPENINKYIEKADEKIFETDKIISSSENAHKEKLFSVGDSTFTVANFYTYLTTENQKAFKNISPNAYARQKYQKYVEESLLKYEEKNLEKKYDEYRQIVNEYREGILLFQLMDEKVWSKALTDTVGLREFFSNNRENYKWNERLEAKIYDASDASIIEKLKPLIGSEYLTLPGETISMNFPKNKVDLTQQETAVIAVLADKLEKNPELMLQISGKPTSNDKIKYDTRLSNIKAILADNNIDDQRILTDDQSGSTTAMTFELVGKSKIVMEKIFNKDHPLALQIEQGIFEKDSKPVLSDLPSEVGAYSVAKDDRFYYIVINKILPPTLKELNEVRGLVISDYQNQLEKDWIQSLKNKYAVQVNENSLEKVFKKFETN